jgi:hypothetical protein
VIGIKGVPIIASSILILKSADYGSNPFKGPEKASS